MPLTSPDSMDPADRWRWAIEWHRAGGVHPLVGLLRKQVPMTAEARAYLIELAERPPPAERGRPPRDRFGADAAEIANVYERNLHYVRKAIARGDDLLQIGEAPADAAMRRTLESLKREGIRATADTVRRALTQHRKRARAKKQDI